MNKSPFFLKPFMLVVFFSILWVGLGNDFKNRSEKSKKWSELKNPVPLVKLDDSRRPLSFVPLVDNFYKAVVNINTLYISRTSDEYHGFINNDVEEKGIPYDDLLENFNKKDNDRYIRRINLGSGFVIDPDGYILTNNHVIRGATKVNVTFWDSREFEARIAARDADNDIALLKISSVNDIPFVPLGNSDVLSVGEWVVAIGNPYGLSHSVTAGIVSAKGRLIGLDPVHTFIQTDAAINPGNSGGPLFNINGEVIGINTAIIANGTGIGFAIPVSRVKRVIEKIIPDSSDERSWLGIRIQPVDKLMSRSFGMSGKYGVLVGDVVSGSPAERGGIKTGDVITNYNGIKTDTCRSLFVQIEKTVSDEPAEINILRGGKMKILNIIPEKISRKFLIRSSTELTNILGILVEDLPAGIFPEGSKKVEGVVVKSVEEGSVGYRAMLAEGDIIIELNGKNVGNAESFNDVMNSASSGRNFLFLVYRNEKTFYSATSRRE